MAGIAADKIRLEFLSRCHQMAEECFQDSRRDLKDQRQEILRETKKEMEQVIGGLVEQYRKKMEEGETGEPENLYLSFLRTGILDGGSWYRLDLYDARDRISEVECWDNLKLSRILKSMKEGMERIQKEWGKQAKVGAFEWDPLAYQLAERYRPLMEEVLESAVTELLKKRGKEWFGEQAAEFWMGEFLDRAERVCRWENGRVVTREELRCREDGEGAFSGGKVEWKL